MVHVLYQGDVHGGEAVKRDDVKASQVFRVKTKSGRYYHILADSEKAAKEWAEKD